MKGTGILRAAFIQHNFCRTLGDYRLFCSHTSKTSIMKKLVFILPLLLLLVAFRNSNDPLPIGSALPAPETKCTTGFLEPCRANQNRGAVTPGSLWDPKRSRSFFLMFENWIAVFLTHRPSVGEDRQSVKLSPVRAWRFESFPVHFLLFLVT